MYHELKSDFREIFKIACQKLAIKIAVFLFFVSPKIISLIVLDFYAHLGLPKNFVVEFLGWVGISFWIVVPTTWLFLLGISLNCSVSTTFKKTLTPKIFLNFGYVYCIFVIPAMLPEFANDTSSNRLQFGFLVD